MTKYKKKPVVIEATQWFKNGDHPLDYSKTHDGLENGVLRQFSPQERRANNWEGEIVRRYRRPDDRGDRVCGHCGKAMREHGWIETNEGGHVVCPGDWIITGVEGEHYPCKPSIFWATHEPVEEPPSGQSAGPAGAPDRIFLVIGEDVTPDTPFSQLAEVTWCAERVDDTDIEYVRAQPAAATPDEIEGLRAHVALLKSALAQSERENDELRRAQPAAATVTTDAQAIRDAALEEAAAKIDAMKTGTTIDLVVQAFADAVRALKGNSHE